MTRQLFNLTVSLILTVVFTSCNEQPKLVKTQGSTAEDKVHCGLQDKSGNLWFGTTGEGVYCYDGKVFTQYTVKDGLSSNTVRSILQDKTGNLWFGTDNGVSHYDGKIISHIPNSVIKGGVWSIMQDKSGKLWFATTGGVYCYNGKFFTRFLDNDSILNSYNGIQTTKVECILEDKAGNIWFGGRGNVVGAFRFDGKSLTSFKPQGDFKPGGDNWVWPVLEDKHGNIWFSNFSGAYRYDGKSFTSFTKNDSLCCIGTVTQVIEDKNGNIWFANDRENGGICRYDGKSFTHFTTKDGLINNSISTILEDKNGNLWVGTRNTGLCRYDGKTFTNFSE